MRATLKIEGSERIITALAKKDANLIRALKDGFVESADYVKERAKRRAPKRRGRLKSAIASGDMELSRGKAKIDVGIDSSVKPFSKDGYYARFQEMGTSKMRAHPYLRPALDESKSRVEQIISQKLKEAL